MSSQSSEKRTAALSTRPRKTMATTPGTSLPALVRCVNDGLGSPVGLGASKYPSRVSRCFSSGLPARQASACGGGAGESLSRLLRAMPNPPATYDPPDTDVILSAVAQLGPGLSEPG